MVAFGWATDMANLHYHPHSANMGWEMGDGSAACDFCDLPGLLGGGVIRAAELHRAHVATLAADFCRVVGVREFAAGVTACRHPAETGFHDRRMRTTTVAIRIRNMRCS